MADNDEKPNASLANQDEKNKPTKAPEVSHAQLKMINVSLQNQLQTTHRILLEISETCREEGTKAANTSTALLNMSQNIKNLFKQPQPQGNQQASK